MLNTRLVHHAPSEIHSDISIFRELPPSRIKLNPSVYASLRWRRFSRSPPMTRPKKHAAKNYKRV
jgi:hypothetical protein